MASLRIAKHIARSGVCSRRAAEELIKAGRVMLDGKIILSPAVNIDETNKILIDGKPLPETEKTRLWVYYKPRGLINSYNDPQGRSTIFSTLPASMPKVISVGRLDYNSEGLLLLTNDGGLSRYLEHPSNNFARKYRVRVFGVLNMEEFSKLNQGILIDGVKYKAIQIELERQMSGNSWLIVTLNEGKNREIRKILQYFGLSVNRLIRINYGPFEIANLKAGELQEIPSKLIMQKTGWEQNEDNSR